MPRSRNIKHSFFTNDELAEIDPLGRLLFIGMWTIADYKGDFEWREKRIKASLMPYDNCDIKKIAINLDKSGFIRFYSDGERVFVRVVNFTKHQNPHKNEKLKGSEIPEFTAVMRQAIDLEGLTINRDLSRLNQDYFASDRADSCSLIPDSCSLIDDPRTPDQVGTKVPGEQKKKKRFTKPTIEDISNYCAERNNKVNPTLFFDHYESNGWKVGKNPMKDWKASIRTWEQKQSESNQQSRANSGRKLSVAERATEARKDWERRNPNE